MINTLINELATEERQLKREMSYLSEMLTIAVTDLNEGADLSEMQELVMTLDNVRSKLIALRYTQKLARVFVAEAARAT